MSRPQSITFANLTCRFGDKYVLLDLAEQIVFPAFFDTTLRRSYGKTQFLFLNPAWATFTYDDQVGEDLIIYGRIVKDTVLARDQVLIAGELVEDHETIPSAPSSFFVFILSNHKLILLPETPSAPTLEVFAATFENFVKRKREQFLNAVHRYRLGTDQEISKSELYEQMPPPKVEALPLASQESIEQFIATIETLTSIEFKLLDTNRETQMLAAYQQFRQKKLDMRAKTTKISFTSPDGLDKLEAASQIKEAAASGNQSVSIIGKAADGSRISGNNDRIRLHVEASDLPVDPQRKAFRLLESFRETTESGTISLDSGDNTLNRTNALAEGLRGRTNLGSVPEIDAGPLFLRSSEVERAAGRVNLLGWRNDGE